ncbi:MAG: hypothetical protein MUC88_20315 [Planctomycetes bacterium]|jgi:hypothetical protein|nr:hypothetical protein [Planctomycetota bacterium]
MTLTLPGLLAPGLAQSAQEQTPVGASKVTYTISGAVGLAGVVMKGLPGDPITDARGNYGAQVSYGWSGTVTPAREGVMFEPATRTYPRVTADFRDENYYVAQVRMATRTVAPVSTGDVFVIPTAQVVPERIAETADDLRIMLQILREKLSEPRLVRGSFVDFGDFFSDRDRAFQAFHLQGSAVVFVLEMDSPFSFAPVPPGESEAQKDAVDPVWQRARQKIYAPQDPTLRGSRGRPGETDRLDFQQFKEDLTRTLRHAANLRHVEPNEWVVLTIVARAAPGGWLNPATAGGVYGADGAYGGAMSFEGSSYSTSGSSFGPGGGSTYADSRTRSSGSTAGRGRPTPVPAGSAPAASATVLTIQAKKADIDAFAQGSLPFEQFQPRVKTFMY